MQKIVNFEKFDSLYNLFIQFFSSSTWNLNHITLIYILTPHTTFQSLSKIKKNLHYTMTLTCGLIFLMTMRFGSSTTGASFLNQRIFLGGGSPTISQRMFTTLPASLVRFVSALVNLSVPLPLLPLLLPPPSLLLPAGDAASASVLRITIETCYDTCMEIGFLMEVENLRRASKLVFFFFCVVWVEGYI